MTNKTRRKIMTVFYKLIKITIYNALICAHRYKININDISTDCVINAKCIIISFL